MTNSVTNAWAGSIETSIDNKGTYSAMECQDCTGDVSTTEYIVVDGNDDGKGQTQCLNGNVCTLVNVATREPSSEVSQAFLNVDALPINISPFLTLFPHITYFHSPLQRQPSLHWLRE